MPKRRPLSDEELHARRSALEARARRGELRLPGAIREMRDALGLTQAAFADRCGLTRMQLIDLEKGRRNPKAETLERLCGPFRLTLGFVPTPDAPDQKSSQNPGSS